MADVLARNSSFCPGPTCPDQSTNISRNREQDNERKVLFDLKLLQIVTDVFFYVRSVEIVVGIVGNVIALAVLRRISFRGSSSAVYLRALAVVDSLFLTGIAVGMEPSLSSIVCTNNVSCRFLNHAIITGRSMSIWILILFTGERLICVVRPYDAKTLLSPRRSVWSLAVTFLAVALFSSRNLWAMSRNRCIRCRVFYSDEDALKKIFKHLDTSVNFILPVLFVSISCVVILIQVRRKSFKYKERVTSVKEARGNLKVFSMNSSKAKCDDDMPGTNDPDVCHVPTSVTRSFGAGGNNARNVNRDRGMFVTLVALNVLFIVTRLPLMMYISVKQNDSSPEEAMVTIILTTIELLNQVLNIFLYAWTGSKFRAELVAMFKDVGCARQKTR